MNPHLNNSARRGTARNNVGVPKQEALLQRWLVATLLREPLKRGYRRIVVSELDVWHGIADIVVATARTDSSWAELLSPSHLKCLNLTSTKLLAQLRYGGYTPVLDIVRSTGFTHRTVWTHLQTLERIGLVRRKDDSARLLRSTKSPFVDVMAFEVKVSDWRHGLYQATHYRSFAHRSVVALPDEKARAVAIHKDTFRRFGIGLVGIKSPRSMRWYIKPMRRKPASTSRALLSLFQILKRRQSRALRQHGK